MATIYYGLNVSKAMNDIDNESIALSNLGLNIENLELIRGLDTYIDRDEFHNLAGLVDDQRQVLSSLLRSSNTASFEALQMPSVDADQVFNYDIDNKLISGSIKYNYTEFTPTSWNRLGADISTSRVSSWSPFGPEDNPDQLIVYNANILNKGEFLSLTDLALTTEPEQKQYEAETATDNLRLMINGAPVSFPVMRGIPFRFTVRRNKMNFSLIVNTIPSPSGGFIKPTLVRKNIETGAIIQEKTVTPSTSGSVTFSNTTADTTTTTQHYDIYYNPAEVVRITASSNGMTTWPRVVMSKLDTASLNSNLYNFIPNFDKYAPNLVNLYMSSNTLYNSDQYANETNLNSDGSVFAGTIQANIDRIPSSVKRLDLSYSLRGDGRNLDWSRFNFETLILKNHTRYGPYLELGETYPPLAAPTARFRFNPQQTVPGLTQNTGTFSTGNEPNPFVNGDIVAYNFHVERDPNLTDPDDDEVLGGVTGSAIGGLTAGDNLTTSPGNNLYEVFIQGTPGNTFRLKTYVPGSPGTGSLIVPSNTGSGTFHSLVKWNTTDNVPEADPTIGLTNFDTRQTTFRYLPQSVCDSPRLTDITLNYAVNLAGNFENRFIDNTNSTTLAKSNAERKLYFNTRILRTARVWSGGYNALDFSVIGNTTLNSQIHIESWPNTGSFGVTNYEKYSPSDKTYTAAKFNCPNVGKISLVRNYGSNARGTKGWCFFNMDDVCKNKNQGFYNLEFNSNRYLQFDYNNGTFSDNRPSNTLKHYGHATSYMPHDVGLFPEEIQNATGKPIRPGIFDHDFFGLSGAAGSNKTGLVFNPLRSMYITMEFRKHNHQAIRFVDDSFGASDQRTLGLNTMPNQGSLKFDQCTIYGKIPDYTNNGYIRDLEFKNTNLPIAPWQMPPGEVCKMEYATDISRTSSYYNFTAESLSSSSGGYYDPQELIDMGWSQYKPAPNSGSLTRNSDFVPWGDSTARGSTPLGTDWFTFNYMNPNNLYEGVHYFIVDPSGTSQSQWETLGLPSGVTAQKGLIFKASANAPRKSLGSIVSGTEYRILRPGDDHRVSGSNPTSYAVQPNSFGASNNNVGTVFTANNDGDHYTATNYNGSITYNRATDSGAYVELTSGQATYGTGKVIPAKMKAVLNPGTTWELEDSNGEISGVSRLKTFDLSYGNFYGSFPTIKQDAYGSTKQMNELDIRNNNFNGAIPDLNNIETVTKVYAQNNQFRTHTFNTLELATNLNTLDLSNNALEAASAFTIIQDLYANWADNTRRNVVVNLSGQVPGYDSSGNEIARCSLQVLNEDPNKSDTSSAWNRRNFLIDNEGWTITMDNNKFASQGT